jgi:hypothetical protein
MFASHASKNLSAYCHGELSETESRQVAEHLIGCRRCQMEVGQIKFAIGLAERLPIAPAPESMWSEIQNEQVDGRLRVGVSRSRAGWPGRKLRWQALVPISAALIIAAAIGFVVLFNNSARNQAQLAQIERPIELVAPSQPKQINPTTNPDQVVKSATEPEVVKSGSTQPGAAAPFANGPFTPSSNTAPSWEVSRLEGTPKVGSNVIDGSSRLSVGESLETDGSSRAKINVADIGEVDVGPNSRVRLIETRATKHVLALDRGRMHAVIDAPPRLFFV